MCAYPRLSYSSFSLSEHSLDVLDAAASFGLGLPSPPSLLRPITVASLARASFPPIAAAADYFPSVYLGTTAVSTVDPVSFSPIGSGRAGHETRKLGILGFRVYGLEDVQKHVVF